MEIVHGFLAVFVCRSCCFSDITQLDYAKKRAFCVTHGTFCKLKPDEDEGVSLLAA